jgi:hypothetical protein
LYERVAMKTLPHRKHAGLVLDPVDPGILYAAPDTEPGLIQRGEDVKAWIREDAVSPAARRCALWMSPDAIIDLHDAVELSLARPLPEGEAGEGSFRKIFSGRSLVGRPVVDALVAARALFKREAGYWPKKILSRCHTPLHADQNFHIVEHAHFDSYEDPNERFVMIVTLSGNGPVLIRNPMNERPENLESHAFAVYAAGLRRRFGQIKVRPGSIVLKKANHRGARVLFDLLPHFSGRVSEWPLLGKRVAFTIS